MDHFLNYQLHWVICHSCSEIACSTWDKTIVFRELYYLIMKIVRSRTHNGIIKIILLNLWQLIYLQCLNKTHNYRNKQILPELSERQHSSPAATICKYCIQGKFCPRFIFALLSEGEFKTGWIELYTRAYIIKLERGRIQDWANQSQISVGRK